MTGEEFLQAAEYVIVPAIGAMIGFAFQTVPQDDVAPLIASYMARMTQLAVERVHEIIADGGHSRGASG